MNRVSSESALADPGGFRGRGVCLGVMLWLLFCVTAVAVRGVRWDETFEHAQIIARQVPYPDGHPLFRYVRGAFSLQTYSAALLAWLGAGPGVLCGLRNALFLAATAIPLFLLTAAATRRVLWAHIAVLLALEGIYLSFEGSYPIMVWPDLFSNGHIGAGYALLTLWALASMRWRLGAFLLGMMPCVHVGQMPVLAAWAFLWTAWQWYARREPELLKALKFLAAGAAVCVAFYAVQRHFGVAPPISGAYCVEGDTASIWRDYTGNYDIHRSAPPGNGYIALGAALYLLAAASYLEKRRGNGTFYRALLLYVFGVTLCVASILAIHRWLGAGIPFVLISWMPYRLINHVPPILLAAMAGLLAGFGNAEDRATRAGNAALLLLLAVAAARPLFAALLPASFAERYVVQGDAVFFSMIGATASLLCMRLRDERPAAAAFAAVPGVAGVAALAVYHQFGAACVLAGASTFFAAALGNARLPERRAAALSAILCGAVVAALLAHEWSVRRHLPVSVLDRRATQYLREQGEPRAMLAAAPGAFILQARTGHPVFVETATASLIGYMPSLGPVIQQMYADVYGIRFDEPPTEQGAHPWTVEWARRDAAEWNRLADAYGFRYLLAPRDVRLSLPLVFTEGGTSLYRIPRSKPGKGR